MDNASIRLPVILVRTLGVALGACAWWNSESVHSSSSLANLGLKIHFLPASRLVLKQFATWHEEMSLFSSLTTERSEVVPFFRAVRAKKRGREATICTGGGSPSVRQFFQRKLSWMSTNMNETWQESSLGYFGWTDTAAFLICHQGAKLFSAESENFGVFAILTGFWCYHGLYWGKRSPEIDKGLLGSVWGSP